MCVCVCGVCTLCVGEGAVYVSGVCVYTIILLCVLCEGGAVCVYGMCTV